MKLRRLLLIIGGLVVLAILVCVGSGLVARIGGQRGTPTPEGGEETAEIAVRARGEVVPALWTELGFGTSGRLLDWLAAEGDTVEAGAPLGRLDAADLERSLAEAQLELERAEIGLAALTEPADDADIHLAQGAVGQATADLEVAELQLATVLSSTLLNESLEDAQSGFDQAQGYYERRLEEYRRGEVNHWYVERAREAFEDAQLALARAQQQADLELEDARTGVAQAGQAYQEAVDELDDLLAGVDAQELEEARLDLEAARLALEKARSALDGATLVAPFDGTIVTLHLQPHQWAEPGAAAVTMADLASLRVESTDLDEWGAAQIEIGSEATVVFNAFEDKTLTGRVAAIELRGEELASGDVVYRTVIELDALDPDLRWGMTVRITIPLEE